MSSSLGKGGQTPAGQTTTTTTQPSYMYPYIGTALSQAGSLLASGGPQYYPGQTVAGFSDPQQAAFSGIDSMASGSSLKPAADYTNSLLTGNFSGPEAKLAQTGQGGATNPYLDQMYRQAAGQTQNQLTSEFAGMGRNAAASEPLRAEQLNNLATNLYGGAYQQDQADALAANQALAGMQNNAVGSAQNLDMTRLGLLNAQAGVGQQVQNLAQQQIGANQQQYNYYQQLPYQQLQQYEQFLQGVQPGSQTSNPYFTNPTANALGTALAAQQLYNGYQGNGGAMQPTNATTSPYAGPYAQQLPYNQEDIPGPIQGP